MLGAAVAEPVGDDTGFDFEDAITDNRAVAGNVNFGQKDYLNCARLIFSRRRSRSFGKAVATIFILMPWPTLAGWCLRDVHDFMVKAVWCLASLAPWKES